LELLHMHPSKRARPLRAMSCDVVIITLDGPRLDVVSCILMSGSAGATLPVVATHVPPRATAQDVASSRAFAAPAGPAPTSAWQDLQGRDVRLTRESHHRDDPKRHRNIPGRRQDPCLRVHGAMFHVPGGRPSLRSEAPTGTPLASGRGGRRVSRDKTGARREEARAG